MASLTSVASTTSTSPAPPLALQTSAVEQPVRMTIEHIVKVLVTHKPFAAITTTIGKEEKKNLKTRPLAEEELMLAINALRATALTIENVLRSSQNKRPNSPDSALTNSPKTDAATDPHQVKEMFLEQAVDPTTDVRFDDSSCVDVLDELADGSGDEGQATEEKKFTASWPAYFADLFARENTLRDSKNTSQS